MFSNQFVNHRLLTPEFSFSERSFEHHASQYQHFTIFEKLDELNKLFCMLPV